MTEKVDMVEGDVCFDPDDTIYADHFPGHPVVPGTLIIHAFLTAALGLEWQSMPASIRDFRFKRFISPGRYRYRFQKDGAKGCLVCHLYDGKDIVASGIFI